VTNLAENCSGHLLQPTQYTLPTDASKAAGIIQEALCYIDN